MNAPVTRRALLGATAAVSAVGLPTAVPALASTADLDAELFDLIARHAEAVVDMHRAWRTFEGTSAAYDLAAPLQPDALLWRPGDFPRTSYGLGLSTPIKDVEGEERRAYQQRAADWLRGRPAATWFRTLSPALGPECEVRRLEILDAWDRWQAEQQAVKARVGLTAAGAASDAAADLVVTLAAEIAASRPRTLPGLRAFGAWFARQVAVDDLHDDFLEQLAEAVAGFGVSS